MRCGSGTTGRNFTSDSLWSGVWPVVARLTSCSASAASA